VGVDAPPLATAPGERRPESETVRERSCRAGRAMIGHGLPVKRELLRDEPGETVGSLRIEWNQPPSIVGP
jgi:hypothetical protein